MSESISIEDFSKNEAKFDKRFPDESACRESFLDVVGMWMQKVLGDRQKS